MSSNNIPGFRRRNRANESAASTLSVQEALSNPSRYGSVNALERLCTSILDWRVLDEMKNEIPQRTEEFRTLPDKFESIDDYIDVWEPLVITELKAAIRSNMATNTRNDSNFGVVFASFRGDMQDTSSTVHLDCSTSNPRTSNQTTIETDSFRRDKKLINMDLVLISFTEIPSPINATTLAETPMKIYFLGLVVQAGNKIVIRITKNSWRRYIELLRLYATGMEVDKSVITNVYRHQFHYAVLDNLVSPWREYMSLFDLATSCKLSKDILKVSNEKENRKHESFHNLTRQFGTIMKEKFNESQFDAILTAANDNGFILIQGPPGTGKTATILGILNSIHLREYNLYYEMAIDQLLGPRGLECRISDSIFPLMNLVADLSSLKPHILVAAPSNVAVDNIIQRIFDLGFIDGNGNQYFPGIVRLGNGKGDRVKSVSLEVLAAKEMDAVPNGEKQMAMDYLYVQLREFGSEIVRLQGLLMSLKGAFLSHPLPPGWELRVDPANGGAPYWVDHNKQETSMTPPETSKEHIVEQFVLSQEAVCNGIKIPQRTEYKNGDYTLQTLPEFQYFSFTLTQLLDKVEAIYAQYKRTKSGLPDNLDVRREVIEKSIIDKSHLVFTTLNSAGHVSLESTRFEVTVIDEAAQCTEPSILLALRRGCRKCVMVGDPMQLPATIFSDSARRAGYDRSLLERLMNIGHPYIMLDTQYRMHPHISNFPSNEFYRGLLKNGDNVCAAGFGTNLFQTCRTVSESTAVQKSSDNICIKSESDGKSILLPNVAFIDLVASRDVLSRTGNLSRSNPEEAKLCVNLISYLLRLSSLSGISLGSMAVISPYSEQVVEVKRLCDGQGWINGANKIDIELNTVDAFQGREKDIVIITTVRSNDQGSIGFLSDIRRMNVALTRAKFGLFVIGSADTLLYNEHWGHFVKYCASQGFLRRAITSSDDLSEILSHPVGLPSDGESSRKRRTDDADRVNTDIKREKVSESEQQDEPVDLKVDIIKEENHA